MHNINNPQQRQLFDPHDGMFSDTAKRRLAKGWQAVFRHVILHLMPAEDLAKRFCGTCGRLTKELYSMCGLIFIMEFMNWTKEQSADAYMFRNDIHYALNLDSPQQSMSVPTINRYLRLFEEDGLHKKIFDYVTAEFIRILDINVEKQRLDSTHIFSNMATFGCTKLMAVGAKRFLTQLKRHDKASWEALPEELRKRYEPARNRLFSKLPKDSESRKRVRLDVAEDLLFLIERFADDGNHNDRSTYKDMVRIFNERCEVKAKKTPVVKDAEPGDSDDDANASADGESTSDGDGKASDNDDNASGDSECISDDDKNTGDADDSISDGDANASADRESTSDKIGREVVLKKKPGGDVMQNPSDPDATYDGHKGSGYQAQVAHTSGEDQTNVITFVDVETAVEHDSHTVPKFLETASEKGLRPKELIADTHYGSDENVILCEENGVNLNAPVPGNADNNNVYKLTIDDFNIGDKTEEVECCPAGNRPLSSVHDSETGRTVTVMNWEQCQACEFRGECPVKLSEGRFELRHSAKERRIAARRRERETEPFREQYRKRAGVEGIFSAMKRRMGLGRLRVRGSPRVEIAVVLRAAGFNLLMAAACPKMREIIEKAGIFTFDFVRFALFALFGPGFTRFRGGDRLFVQPRF